LPWHDALWRRLALRLESGRLPHALLITGLPGIGKSVFADLLARRCLCERPSRDGLPCGACRGCRLALSGGHPDMLRVEPDDGRRSIRVDQVRDLTAFMMLSSQYAGMRVAVIDPSDLLNINASNALLKTLEEPPEHSALILTASRPGNLPATVRSRCQRIAIAPPSRPEAESWLAGVAPGAKGTAASLSLASGAPLLALRYSTSEFHKAYNVVARTLGDVALGRTHPLSAAESWPPIEPGVTVDLLTRLVAALIRSQYHGAETVHNPVLSHLQPVRDRLDLSMLHSYFQYLLDTKRSLSQPLNEQLMIEDLLVRWFYAARAGSGPRESTRS